MIICQCQRPQAVTIYYNYSVIGLISFYFDIGLSRHLENPLVRKLESGVKYHFEATLRKTSLLQKTEKANRK
jgi:hypothetical protein